MSQAAAIFAADNSRLTITDSSIIGNQAFGDVGGGIATGANVALTVRDSQFFDNTGYYGGGAIHLRGSLSMEDSTVSRQWIRRQRRADCIFTARRPSPGARSPTITPSTMRASASAAA